MAAGLGGRIFVVGGYGVDGHRRRDAFVYANGHWQRLPSMPLERAAGGAAVIGGGKLYVAGGTTGLPGVGDALAWYAAMLVSTSAGPPLGVAPGRRSVSTWGRRAGGGNAPSRDRRPRGRLRHEPPPLRV